MPYRLRWSIDVLWVDAGVGLGLEATHKSTVLTFKDTLVTPSGNLGSGSTATQTFTNADVTTLLNALVTDFSNQAEQSAVQTRIQNWGANTFPATL